MLDMTREKAFGLVYFSGSMALRVDETESCILILAYSNYYRSAIVYYFSKQTDYIEQQILSPVAVNEPCKMRIVENHLEYDC